MSDVLPDTENINPEAIILNEEQEKLTINRLFGKLSALEKEILSYYMEGMSLFRDCQAYRKNREVRG